MCSFIYVAKLRYHKSENKKRNNSYFLMSKIERKMKEYEVKMYSLHINDM